MSATAYVEGKGFSAGALRHWASRLHRSATTSTEIRLAKVVRSEETVEAETPIVIEVARVRVAVHRGFDRGTLREVLETLEDRAR